MNEHIDKELYKYQTAGAMDKEAAQKFITAEEGSATGDLALVELLKEDMESDFAWIAGVENHQDNLPEDPEQVGLCIHICTSVQKVHAQLCQINFKRPGQGMNL